MEDVKLLSEARILSSLVKIPEGYEVRCKHLQCRENYNMGSRKFIEHEEYDVWIAYDLSQNCRRYHVHGLTTRDEILPFSTDKVFGSLEEVIAAPETQSLSYGRWMWYLMSLPELGKTLVPAWILGADSVRQIWDAETKKYLKNLSPGLLNYDNHNSLVWLVQDESKDFKAFIRFDNPTVIEQINCNKLDSFIPLSDNICFIGNNCFWYDGKFIRFT